jgi:enoyl-CoA hydratase
VTSLAELHRLAAERGLARYRTLSKAELEAELRPVAEPSPPVRLERRGPLALIVLDDERSRNGLGRDALDAFDELLGQLETETDVRLVGVLGARGVFSSGSRVWEFDTDEGGEELTTRGTDLCDRLANLPVPVIALVDGPAVGAGAELALAADWRVFTPTGELRFLHAGFGLVPGFGGLGRLRALIGAGDALRVIACRETLDAESAVATGLALAVVPEPDLLLAAQRLAETLEESRPDAVVAAKRALAAEDVRRAERAAFLSCWPERRLPPPR